MLTQLSQLNNFSSSETETFFNFCLQHKNESSSQLFQDLFIRYQLNEREKGYFVEFGATDGIHWSNTKALEKNLQWTGILAEPAKFWHPYLKQNRKSLIDTRCVWEKTGEILEFNEVKSEAELSTIKSFTNADHHGKSRIDGDNYQVYTISLEDLLLTYNAPKKIDYLSIDTEGSEFSILNAFDFSKYQINIITVEHNYTFQREEIFKLLTKNGFSRKFIEFSMWDDWYVNQFN
ncbi:FkbM family methyltransferase [Geminocystis sp.]|uniref:FkbM family methyltransferase n=1 Tax=Geminocystis sp. TaxID=2664100 RepID=UPI0035947966